MELGDNLADNVRELPNETRRILNEASDRIAKYYEVSSEFVRENQMITLAGASFVALVAGFFIGRSSKD